MMHNIRSGILWVLSAIVALLAIKPKRSNIIQWKEVDNLLQAAFGEKSTRFLVDKVYYTISKNEMEIFLAKDATDKSKYIAEEHDCDDYAAELWGKLNTPAWSKYAIAWACSKVHAYNVFISPEPKVYIIEPQNDAIFLADENVPTEYKTEFILM